MKLYELQAQKKAQEPKLNLEPCVECGKGIEDGYWGTYYLGNGKYGGVCSKTCSILFMKEKKKSDILGSADDA